MSGHKKGGGVLTGSGGKGNRPLTGRGPGKRTKKKPPFKYHESRGEDIL